VLTLLIVAPPGSPVISGPTVIKNGDSVTITCSSTGGDPTPTVKWLRDDVVFDDLKQKWGHYLTGVMYYVTHVFLFV
jgi:hypothetical protein